MCTRLKNDGNLVYIAVLFSTYLFSIHFYLNCNCFLSYSILIIISSINPRRRLIFFHYFSFLLLVGPAATTKPPIRNSSLTYSSLFIVRNAGDSIVVNVGQKQETLVVDWRRRRLKRLNDVWRGWIWQDPLKIITKKGTEEIVQNLTFELKFTFFRFFFIRNPSLFHFLFLLLSIETDRFRCWPHTHTHTDSKLVTAIEKI